MSNNPRTIDIKVAFEIYDMVPGPAGRKFRRNLLLHGTKADERGYSIADTYLRIDEGATVAGGAGPAPGAPALPGGAGGAAALRHRRTRVKNSFQFIVAHISDDNTLTFLADPTNPLYQDGPETYDYVMAQVIPRVLQTDLDELNLVWLQLSIVEDIGISENTVQELLKTLRILNAERPGPEQFNDDAIAVKILTMIKDCSNHFSEKAIEEINALEGVPGQPSVRLWQLAAPAAGGPRPRDLLGMVGDYHAKWKDAVKRKIPGFTPRPKTGKAGASRPSHTIDAGRGAEERALGAGEAEPTFAPLAPFRPRSDRLSPTRTLGELVEAGFGGVTRGTTTTTDWRLVGRTELARAADDGSGGNGLDEFCVEVCFDADDQMTLEMLCNNCRGAGHPGRLCPSAKRFRSFAYVARLIANAERSAEERGALQGTGEGGRRPPPRGQRTPFKAMPRRFQQSR